MGFRIENGVLYDDAGVARSRKTGKSAIRRAVEGVGGIVRRVAASQPRGITAPGGGRRPAPPDIATGTLMPIAQPGPSSGPAQPPVKPSGPPAIHPPATDSGGGSMGINWTGVLTNVGTAIVDEVLGGTPSEPAAGGNPAIPGTVTTGGGLVATNAGCPPGTISVAGSCVDPRAALPGGKPFVTPSAKNGAGIMMANGSAPMVESRRYSDCGRGMVLGMDGLCYDRRTIRNDQRMWPRGRKPLLTGGEMNAITKAARAARRVKSTSKKLQKLGLLPKPNRGSRRGSPTVITKAEAARALRS